MFLFFHFTIVADGTRSSSAGACDWTKPRSNSVTGGPCGGVSSVQNSNSSASAATTPLYSGTNASIDNKVVEDLMSFTSPEKQKKKNSAFDIVQNINANLNHRALVSVPSNASGITMRAGTPTPLMGGATAGGVGILPQYPTVFPNISALSTTTITNNMYDTNRIINTPIQLNNLALPCNVMSAPVIPSRNPVFEPNRISYIASQMYPPNQFNTPPPTVAAVAPFTTPQSFSSINSLSHSNSNISSIQTNFAYTPNIPLTGVMSSTFSLDSGNSISPVAGNLNRLSVQSNSSTSSVKTPNTSSVRPSTSSVRPSSSFVRNPSTSSVSLNTSSVRLNTSSVRTPSTSSVRTSSSSVKNPSTSSVRPSSISARSSCKPSARHKRVSRTDDLIDFGSSPTKDTSNFRPNDVNSVLFDFDPLVSRLDSEAASLADSEDSPEDGETCPPPLPSSSPPLRPDNESPLAPHYFLNGVTISREATEMLRYKNGRTIVAEDEESSYYELVDPFEYMRPTGTCRSDPVYDAYDGLRSPTGVDGDTFDLPPPPLPPRAPTPSVSSDAALPPEVVLRTRGIKASSTTQLVSSHHHSASE